MRHPGRRTGRGAGGRTRPGGPWTSAAALLGAAALVVSLAPAAAAATGAAGPPGPAGPAGRATATPALVSGIREQAPAGDSAADAARAYLDQRRDRYRIPDARHDLVPGGTTGAHGEETVRLRQRHRGVPVLGGEYVVRMENHDGRRTVTGTSGKYFTGLTTGTTDGIGSALAVERAVDAVLGDLDDHHFAGRPAAAPGTDPADLLHGTDHGLVVLPAGPGVLTRHITVRGTGAADGTPVVREVYIDAHAGYPVLQYSGVQTFGAARPAAGSAPATPAARPLAAAEKGTGVRLDGTEVPLDIEHDETEGAYVLRDSTRIPQDDYHYGVLSTWDARGREVADTSGTWPDGIKEFSSPAPAFGADATASGAVDAHWAAGRVYDYFRAEHGRDSLDGHGMTVNSLVGVTGSYGTPYANAFWDGQKMVYGGGDEEYLPFSAALDVVGHEMTHGVIAHTANLMYAGQSGALNEAIADYFGNTIEASVYGIPADDPDSGLLGERLCRTKGPRACATRDLDDGRTTTGSFVGVDFLNDNGGVHLNSTIFGGALWDARTELGAAVTDRIVYRALTQYLTPLDGFTEGRAAVLAAAKDLGTGAAQLKRLKGAFTAHGIVPGWELALGSDSQVLFERINTAGTDLGAGGGWWAASRSNEDGSEPSSVWAGRADGKGQPKLMSPNDGRYHTRPATDGRTVVWQAHGPGGVDILARSLSGGPVRTLWHGRSVGGATGVDGDVVAFDYYTYGGRSGVVHLSLKDPQDQHAVGGGTYHRAHGSSVSHGKVAFQDMSRVGLAATYTWTTRVADVATGEDRAVQRYDGSTSLGPTALNGTHVFWLLDEGLDANATTLRRAALDGSEVADLSPGSGPDALNAYDLAVSEDTAVVGTYLPDTVIRNESTPKLYQFAANGTPGAPGTRLGRVSCNRGAQTGASAPGGSQVIWLDSTTGRTDVVTRARPTGRCG
ncbi:M4 family metallopeptidase [Streptomyces sp. NPDC018057]|uniref:M4 family metallopeptidase n=1 Tax=unclassified Streptomyces TaxID=2593676 RepID=UPI00378755DB